MITVAGQMFIEYEKEKDIYNQIFSGDEECFGDNKFKIDIKDKVCGDNVKKNCAEKDEVYKNNSIN